MFAKGGRSFSIELECKKALNRVLILERFVGKLEGLIDMEEIGKYTYSVNLSDVFVEDLPVISLYYALGSLLEHLPAGLCAVRGLEIPSSRMKEPALGKSGLKKYLGLRGPALAASVGKNAIFHPLDHARLFHEMCDAGLNVGLDPPYLLDMEISPYLDRAHQIVETIDRMREDGKKVLYLMRLPNSVEELEKAISLGVKGFYAHLCLDLDKLRSFSEFYGKAFLAARELSCLMRNELRPELFYRILRASGFDLVERPVALGRDDVRLVRDIDGIIGSGRRPAIPITSPQVHQGVAVANIPEDLLVILHADLGIYDHPNGIIAGVRSMKEVLDSFMRGENLLSVIRRDRDVEAMVERWGDLPL